MHTESLIRSRQQKQNVDTTYGRHLPHLHCKNSHKPVSKQAAPATDAHSGLLNGTRLPVQHETGSEEELPLPDETEELVQASQRPGRQFRAFSSPVENKPGLTIAK
jgi:hypothetical protein